MPIRTARGAPAAVALTAFLGCVAPPREPVDLSEMLIELRAVAAPAAWEGEGGGSSGTRGVTPDQAAAFAVRTNPSLVAARRRLGVAEADVVVAGLLPDPTLGFDLADLGVLRARTDDGGHVRGVELSSGPLDFVAGVDLEWPLLRPGERRARMGVAEADLLRTRADVAAAEWRLVGEVRLACLEVRAARERLRLADESLAIAERSSEFFLRARRAGEATALQADLVAVDRERLRLRRDALQVDLERAWERLDALLGLPPTARFALAFPDDPLEPRAHDIDVAAAVEEALGRRPDLRLALADYERAEREVALEAARRLPALAVGTAFSFTLPIFSRFNRPALETALRRREAARERVRALVHDARAEIHAAHALWRRAHRTALGYRERLAPSLEDSLAQVDLAFRRREVNLLEVLAVQRRVLEARADDLEARIEEARARIRFDTACARGRSTFATAKAPEEGEER